MPPSRAGSFCAAALPGKGLQSGLPADVDPFQGAAGWLCPSSVLTGSYMAMWSGTRVNTRRLSAGLAATLTAATWLLAGSKRRHNKLASVCKLLPRHTFGLAGPLRVRQLPLKLAPNSCVLSRAMLLGRTEISLHYIWGLKYSFYGKTKGNIQQVLIQSLWLKKILWRLIVTIKCYHNNHNK